MDETLNTGYTPEVQPATPTEETAPVTQAETLAERHPDWPTMNLNIKFGPHGGAADMAGVEAALQSGGVDIYFYENSAIDKAGLSKMFQSFSDADLQAEPRKWQGILNQVLAGGYQGTHHEPIARGLMGTGHCRWLHMNLGGQYPEIAARLKAAKDARVNLSSGYKHALDSQAHIAHEYVDVQREREGLIVGNIEAELERLMRERPALVQKTELSIVMSMGELHTTLARDIRQSSLGLPVRSELLTTAENNPWQRLVSELMWELEPDETLQAKALMQHLLTEHVDEFVQIASNQRGQFDFSSLGIYFSGITDRFDSAEIEGLFNAREAGTLNG